MRCIIATKIHIYCRNSHQFSERIWQKSQFKVCKYVFRKLQKKTVVNFENTYFVAITMSFHSNLRTISPLVLSNNPFAKTDTTNKLMRNDMKSAAVISIKKYIFASRILFGLRRSTSRVWNWVWKWIRFFSSWKCAIFIKMYFLRTFTNAECKNRLCGWITAPMIPIACSSAFESQFSHHGVNIPFSSSPWFGAEITY